MAKTYLQGTYKKDNFKYFVGPTFSLYKQFQILYPKIMEENPNYKNRSVAIVIRDGKILMERLCYKDANNGKEFFSVPGGGIEEG